MGVSVIDGYFPQDFPDREQRFDAIAMLDVLEHIVEPRPFLREVKARLNAGGLLFVQVPNWHSLRSSSKASAARSSPLVIGHI